MLDVAGAFDLHVHSAPCLFPRLADDLMTARACASVGMRGMLFKSHHESTVGRACVVNAVMADNGLKVYGSITLNHAVGGVNPMAVDAALRTGARMVWMPTIDSQAHADAFGGNGHWDVQRTVESNRTELADYERPAPLSILRDGTLTPEALAVLALCHEREVALGTGHLGQDEVMALAAAAHERGFRRLIITHPLFRVPGFRTADLAHLAHSGVFFEFTYCSISPMWRHTTIDECITAVQTVGANHAFFSSDGGQTHNPMPHEGLRLIAQMSIERGLSIDDARRMICDVPLHLMGT